MVRGRLVSNEFMADPGSVSRRQLRFDHKDSLTFSSRRATMLAFSSDQMERGKQPHSGE